MIEASGLAAAGVPLPGSAGLECRTVGHYVYTASRPVAQVETAKRVGPAERATASYPRTFRSEWARQSADLESSLSTLDAVDLDDASPRLLAEFYRNAVDAHMHAWTVHFDVMYRLLLVHQRFIARCREFDVDGQQILDSLQSQRNKITDTDTELRELAMHARQHHLSMFVENAGDDLLHALQRSAAADSWLHRFERLLLDYGNRSERVIDVGAPSWREEPTLPLDMIRLLAVHPPGHRSSDEQEPHSHRGSRSIIGSAAPAVRTPLRDAVADVRRANYAWWNEEHNFYIDFRAHLPIRRVGLAIGQRFLDRADDALMLFGNELMELCNGDLTAHEARRHIASRKTFHSEWARRRVDLPATLGDGDTGDPIIEQVFGSHPKPGVPAKDGRGSPGLRPSGLQLTGYGVGPGVARGTVRIIRSPDDLDRLQPGDIMVCVGTTPSWLSAFSRVAACVCELGGPLSHGAIAARETSTPCVVGVVGATAELADGDMIEVNGANGTVTRLELPAT